MNLRKALGLACVFAALGCAGTEGREARPAAPGPGQEEKDVHTLRRSGMLERQIKSRGIRNPHVLRAMSEVPRHEFVPPALKDRAYDDNALPIGSGQTISQPYIVALMTQLAGVEPGDRVLDVGTGSGYQAAVLAEIVERVYSIEILPDLAREAERRLTRLGYDNVVVKEGDGWKGWPEHAPFDAIVLAAAPAEVPPPLVEQLAPGGRLVLPVGNYYQEIVLVTKNEDGTISRRSDIPVRFVPMTGIAQDDDRTK